MSEFNPLERFSGLADIYDRARPHYPEAALQFVLKRCLLKPNNTLVDIGCGTGISSRIFAHLGLKVIGIEPNQDMLAKAKSIENSADAQRLVYKMGSAEQTGLSDASADAVLAAQSFHWFDWSLALPEFARLLKPEGWAILLWNNEDQSDRFTKAYRELFNYSQELPKIEERGHAAAETFLKSELFEKTEKKLFPYAQSLDHNRLLERAFSCSYAPKEPDLREKLATDLKKVFSKFEKQDIVTLHYQTEVYTGRKRK